MKRSRSRGHLDPAQHPRVSRERRLSSAWSHSAVTAACHSLASHGDNHVQVWVWSGSLAPDTISVSGILCQVHPDSDHGWAQVALLDSAGP